MPVALILAILELIIKLPEIVKVIREIIERIHQKPIHLQGPWVTKLQALVFDAHAKHLALGPGQNLAGPLAALAEELKTA